MKRILLFSCLILVLVPSVANAAPTGNFLIACGFDHASNDDPIVFPGLIGSSHLHSFLGVKGIGAFSTTPDLLAKSTTCTVGGETAAVWHPAVINNGVVVNPTSVGIYYRADGVYTYPFPLGLRHVQGNPHNRSASTYSATWRCENSNVVNGALIPATCNGAGMEESIYFKRCWDGESLNPADHHSLVACNGKNIPLPAIQLLIHWPPSAVGGRLSSDIDEGVAGGLTAHADYWFGADPIWFAKIVDRCLNAGIQCRVGETYSIGAILNWDLPYPKPVVISAAESDGVFP